MNPKPKAPKPNPNYYGFKIARGYCSTTVWIFRKKDKRFLGTIKRVPNKGLDLVTRQNDSDKFLIGYGIKPVRPAPRLADGKRAGRKTK